MPSAYSMAFCPRLSESKSRMIASTDIRITPGSLLADGLAPGRQDQGTGFKPLVRVSGTTLTSDPDPPGDTSFTRDQEPRKKFEPPMATTFLRIGEDSTPLQIWEGAVVEVDHEAGVMHVVLDAKIGQIPRHTGEIDLEWVSEQDEDLVRPGAVFYLTLFKRTKRGSIQNSQELRFRRRPSWSTTQLKRIEKDTAMILSKMKTLPTSA
jgi:hypothetical protein